MVVKIERKRYLLVEFLGEPPEVRQLVGKLRQNIATLGGQIALASSSIHVIDVIGSFAIIRATHESRDMVEAAVQLLNFTNTLAVVRTVSGTIKKINTILHTSFVENDNEDSEYRN